MPICGHQFHGGDESDWILSTSANCLDGSTTANRILQELFKKHRRNMPKRATKKRLESSLPSEKSSYPKSNPETNSSEHSDSPKEENQTLIVKKITGICSFENFDESQHLNGCPMKWLYNKKLLEKNKTYKMKRLCNKKSIKKEEVKIEKCKNLRDKTPMEVKIRKINLIEKYASNCDEMHVLNSSFPSGKLETVPKDLDAHRERLAAKLNWKLHDESGDDCFSETSSDIRHNYLPPRPLLGLKPLLSVLLTPHRDTNCCSLITLQSAFSKKKNVEASLSIKSLDLLFSPLEPEPQPKLTSPLRWGCRSSLLAKKLQIPNQITIKLEHKKKKSSKNLESHLKIVNSNPPAKKSHERVRQTKSLSSLFYELKDKTNCRNRSDKHFEEMIRDLTVEEGRFKIRRFFNISSANSDFVQTCKVNPEKKKKLTETSSADEMNLVCEKVRFFEKKSSRAIKTEENEKGAH